MSTSVIRIQPINKKSPKFTPTLPPLKSSNDIVEDMVKKIKPIMFKNTLQQESSNSYASTTVSTVIDKSENITTVSKRGRPPKVKDTSDVKDIKISKDFNSVLEDKPVKSKSSRTSKSSNSDSNDVSVKRKGRPPLLDENGNRVHKKVLPKDENTECCKAKTAVGKSCSNRIHDNGVCKTHAKYAYKYSNENKQANFIQDLEQLDIDIDNIVQERKYNVNLPSLADLIDFNNIVKENPPKLTDDDTYNEYVNNFYEDMLTMLIKYDHIILLNNIIKIYHNYTKDQCECGHCLLKD